MGDTNGVYIREITHKESYYRYKWGWWRWEISKDLLKIKYRPICIEVDYSNNRYNKNNKYCW